MGWTRHTFMHTCPLPTLDAYSDNPHDYADPGDMWKCTCGETYTVIVPPSGHHDRYMWDREPARRWVRAHREGEPMHPGNRWVYGPIIPKVIAVGAGDPIPDWRPVE